MLVLRSFLFFVVLSLVAADDTACLKMQIWANEDCSGSPDNSASNTIPTVPTDACVPFDNPTFGTCSLNHQYCDMLVQAFKETVYIANDSCDKDKAIYVQDQSFDSGKCYGGSGQSVLVECTAGACPSDEMTSDHRALLEMVQGIVLE